MGRVAAVLLLVVAGVVSFVAPSASPPSAAAQEELPPLRILSAGDSYASGEGLPGIQRGEEACQRALGLEAEAGTAPSKAWPLLVKEIHEGAHGDVYQRWNVESFWFTACTGTTSEHFSRAATAKGVSQLEEARADAGDEPWDVVTLSFGGNDLGFRDLIYDCIGLDDDLWEPGSISPIVAGDKALFGAYAGCEKTEAEMLADAEALRPRLKDLYGEVGQVTAPGGLVVVTGYPQIWEEPSLWPTANKLRNRCGRVSEGDARSLRSVTGRVNEMIGQEVLAAQAANSDQTWVFVDVAAAFEGPAGRHGLCSADGWINNVSSGLTDGDLRIERSFHPDQDGHWGYARAVVDAIRRSGWTPRPPVSDCSADAVSRDLDVPLDQIFEGPTCVGDWGWIDYCVEDECVHAGHVIQRVDGRWTEVGALLQDCAESFTARGAPFEIAAELFPPCRPPGCDDFPSCAETGRIEFDHPTWGRSTLVMLTNGEVNSRRRMVVVDGAGAVVWTHDMTMYEPITPNDPSTDSTGHLFVNWNPGRYNGVTVLKPVAGGFEDFDTLPPGSEYNVRFYSAHAEDLDGDGVLEIVLNVNDCDPTCAGGTHTISTHSWDGTDYRRMCEVSSRTGVEPCQP